MLAYPGGRAHQPPIKDVVAPSQPHTWGPTAQEPAPGVTGTHTPIAEQPADSL